LKITKYLLELRSNTTLNFKSDFTNNVYRVAFTGLCANKRKVCIKRIEKDYILEINLSE